MTEDEFEAVWLHATMAFKTREESETEATARRGVYHTFLAQHDASMVMAALYRLVERGTVFLPSAGEIVAAMREMEEPAVPGWAEVYPAVIKAIHVGGRGYFDSPAEKTRKGAAWLDEHAHPVIARFFEAESYARLSQTEFDDPEWGELRKKELRDRWEEFVGVAKERLAQGRALEAVGQRSELGPQRLDAVALLEGLKPPPPPERPELDAGTDPPSEE